jgi:tRNA(Ile)-lysidine synthase
LKISRGEIESYLCSISQDFVTDSTNESIDYTRNHIRRILIPEVQKINPNAILSLTRFAESCRDDREYFDSIIVDKLQVDLRTLSKSLRHRIYMKKFKDFANQSLNYDTIQIIDKLLLNQKRSVIPIYADYEAVISNGNIEFFEKNPEFEYGFDEVELKIGKNSVFNGRVGIFVNESNFGELEIFNKISISEKLSSDNIISGLKVRNRKVGDRICIFGVNKSLKKLFIEKKIPKEYRNMIPIICDDDGILYVPFVGIADRAFPKGTSNCIQLNIVLNSIDKERWINAYEK